MAPPARDVWLARGACARCGRPVARRAQGPGRVAATCNVCRATTTLPAVRMSFPAARAPPRAPASQRGRWVLPALLLAVVLVLAGVLAWRHVSEDAAPAPPREAGTLEWARMEERLVPTFGPEEVTLRVEATAYAANGTVVPIERAARPSLWAFAHAPALVAAPRDLDDWTTCSPPACVYRAPAGAFVYFDPSGFGGERTGAFDTQRRELFVHGDDGWRRVEDWEAYFRSFGREWAGAGSQGVG